VSVALPGEHAAAASAAAIHQKRAEIRKLIRVT
jgi:hypothetical protein